MTRKFYMDKEIEENYDVENKKGIVYNGIVQQFGKGMQRSLVARLFWVQNVTGSNPVIPIPNYYLSYDIPYYIPYYIFII